MNNAIAVHLNVSRNTLVRIAGDSDVRGGGGRYAGAALEEYSMLDLLLKAQRTQEDVNRGTSSTRWQNQREKGVSEERYWTSRQDIHTHTHEH